MCDVCSIATVSFDTILVLDPFLSTMGKGKKNVQGTQNRVFFYKSQPAHTGTGTSLNTYQHIYRSVCQALDWIWLEICFFFL